MANTYVVAMVEHDLDRPADETCISCATFTSHEKAVGYIWAQCARRNDDTTYADMKLDRLTIKDADTNEPVFECVLIECVDDEFAFVQIP